MSNTKRLFVIGFTVFVSIIILIGGIFFLQDISIKSANYSFNVIFNQFSNRMKFHGHARYSKSFGLFCEGYNFFNMFCTRCPNIRIEGFASPLSVQN